MTMMTDYVKKWVKTSWSWIWWRILCLINQIKSTIWRVSMALAIKHYMSRILWFSNKIFTENNRLVSISPGQKPANSFGRAAGRLGFSINIFRFGKTQFVLNLIAKSADIYSRLMSHWTKIRIILLRS